MTGIDAIEAIALGATTVQFATAVIRGGFTKIRSIISEMTHYSNRTVIRVSRKSAVWLWRDSSWMNAASCSGT